MISLYPAVPYHVQLLRREDFVEVEIYCRRQATRPYPPGVLTRFLDVGVWCAGGYVLWRREMELDWQVLDIVDSVLRIELPRSVGVVPRTHLPSWFGSGDRISFG